MNRIAAAAMDSIRDQFFSDDTGGGTAAPVLAREAVEASGVAMIRASLVGEDVTSVLRAASDNGGYVTYASRINQTLTLRGSLITASRGLGHDLLSVEPDARDPLVVATPLEEWPESIGRVYRFPDFSPEGRAVAVTCRYVPEQEMEISILGDPYVGRQVREICAGPDAAFENLVFAEAETGFVWLSRQWLGPEGWPWGIRG